MILGHLQIPELVLQHDGHFLGETGLQMCGNIDTGRMGAEGDVEMMVAGLVSYTHLDVYKRQLHTRALAQQMREGGLVLPCLLYTSRCV